MGWIADLRGKTVGLDTSPLIFFIEKHETYADVVRPFFQAVDGGEIHVVTSTVTLLEVLVHPVRHGDEALAHEYNDILLTSANISIFPLTPATAQVAAELRAEHSLKTPDAIQLATSITHGATAFLTNDRDFGKIPGLEIIKLRDLGA
jgi:predicted nucleic acid-binding protein